jgi:hypothetical protein
LSSSDGFYSRLGNDLEEKAEMEVGVTMETSLERRTVINYSKLLLAPLLSDIPR